MYLDVEIGKDPNGFLNDVTESKSFYNLIALKFWFTVEDDDENQPVYINSLKIT
jgi:hypothetical protein